MEANAGPLESKISALFVDQCRCRGLCVVITVSIVSASCWTHRHAMCAFINRHTVMSHGSDSIGGVSHSTVDSIDDCQLSKLPSTARSDSLPAPVACIHCDVRRAKHPSYI